MGVQSDKMYTSKRAKKASCVMFLGGNTWILPSALTVGLYISPFKSPSGTPFLEASRHRRVYRAYGPSVLTRERYPVFGFLRSPPLKYASGYSRETPKNSSPPGEVTLWRRGVLRDPRYKHFALGLFRAVFNLSLGCYPTNCETTLVDLSNPERAMIVDSVRQPKRIVLSFKLKKIKLPDPLK